MDGINVEPGHGLHETQSGLQILLRGTHGRPPASYEAKELPEWIQTNSAAAYARRTAPLEKAANYICELDERPFSRRRSSRLHTTRL